MLGGSRLQEIVGALVASIWARAAFATVVTLEAGLSFLVEELSFFAVDAGSGSIDVVGLFTLSACLVVDTFLTVFTAVFADLTYQILVGGALEA